MNSVQKLLAGFALEASSLILSMTTGVFGAAGLFLQLRFLKIEQFILFQLASVSILMIVGWYPMIVLVVALSILVIFYKWLESQSLFWRGFLATLASTLFILASAYVWIVVYQKQEIWSFLSSGITAALEKARGMPVPLDVDALVYQLPSYIFCLCALNVWIGALFDKRASNELKRFVVPEGAIWFVIASLLFSFIKVDLPGVQEVALNVLNISLLLYFFQGLSVLSFILDAMRFSTLIKWVIYSIFVFQILLPICLGIIDYWLDLRLKLEERLSRNVEKSDKADE